MSDDLFPTELRIHPIANELLAELRASVEAAVRVELARLGRRCGRVSVTVSEDGRIDVNVDWIELHRTEFTFEPPVLLPSVHAAAQTAVRDFVVAATRAHPIAQAATSSTSEPRD